MDERLAFLRRQLKEGPEKYRQTHVQQLLDALGEAPWTAERENEAFALLGRIDGSNADTPPTPLAAKAQLQNRLARQVAALYRLTDRMIAARCAELMKKIEHPENLTRIELRKKQLENRRLAQTGFADRLTEELAKNKDLGLLRSWVLVERLWLDVQLRRNLKQVEEECWELLGPQPKLSSPEDASRSALEQAMQHRLLTTLMHLAVQKGAAPASADRLLAYLDRAIAAADAKDTRWKVLKYELLVALDRPKQIETSLSSWIVGNDFDNQWRLALGYLYAEQGRLKEAIGLFEAIEKADELDAAAYRALADWYMVENQKDRYRRAKIASYKVLEEYELQNLISEYLRPWQQNQGKALSEMDENVLFIFASLFEKTADPERYLSQLRQFYAATRDFRLLAGLVDAVIGHTAQQIYPFLQTTNTVLAEVHDEATADSMIEQLAKTRERAKTDIDRRALDLLELFIERRAAELLNQPGPHADRALTAMQRAFKRSWTPGEPRMMADLLGGLGAMPQPKLAEEQIRQLRSLHADQARGTVDRLHIARRLTDVLWGYAKRDEAIDLLQAALAEHRQAHGGVLPTAANEALDRFIYYLEETRQFMRAETVLLDELKVAKTKLPGEQTLWLMRRIYLVYENAIRHDGTVSLGSGESLYRIVQKQIQADLDTTDQNHRSQLVQRLCSIYRLAHVEKKFAGVADDLRAFAFGRFPKVLKQQTTDNQSLVNQVAQTLHDVAGARDGLAFLIERLENEPRWFRYNNQDGWSQFGWRLGEWRREVKTLGDLEPRLLAIVVAELRRDLESQQARGRSMYQRDSGYFWSEKEAVFTQTVEDVYARRKSSGAAVMYIAQYLYHGLQHFDRAIEILEIAHREKLLDESQQWELVRYLHQRSRYGESIAILQSLIELRPDNITYRVRLMTAYFHTQQPNQLLAVLEQADAHFHKGNRWTEGTLASLAEECLGVQLYEQSVKYYKELIPLHQRSQPNRGIGNGTLSRYYSNLAGAYAGLKKTPEAVDAACGAIVSWGPRNDERANALESLRNVLRRTPDLDGYVATLDRRAEDTGQDNPLIRKAVGMVYKEKNQFKPALAQLNLAVALQPNDAETHRALIECYDRQNDREGAIRQTLASLQLSRRDIGLYSELGRRLGELNQPQEAERAYTSIVEVLSSESESHTMLAEIRERQNRWPEAIVQWQQVARIRALEPTGSLKLAAALIHEKRWAEASALLRKTSSRAWPARFGDVYQQVRQLEQQIPK